MCKWNVQTPIKIAHENNKLYLFPTPPLILINLQTTKQKLPTLFWNPDHTGKKNPIFEDILHTLGVIFASTRDVPE